MKKDKSNLVVLHIYKECINEFVIVLYKPYLFTVLKELFKDTTNYFSTENWRTLLDINNEYDSHILMNYNALKEEFQYAYDNNFLKSIIKFHINNEKSRKASFEKDYKDKRNEIILSYSDDDTKLHHLPTTNYAGHLTHKRYKQFILYLIKQYKLDIKVAYSLYKQGLKTHEFILNSNMIIDNNSNISEILKKLYGSKKIIKELKQAVFNDFYQIERKENAS